MSAHFDPLQYDNTDGTTGGGLKKIESPRRYRGGYPPHTPPSGRRG